VLPRSKCIQKWCLASLVSYMGSFAHMHRSSLLIANIVYRFKHMLRPHNTPTLPLDLSCNTKPSLRRQGSCWDDGQDRTIPFVVPNRKRRMSVPKRKKQFNCPNHIANQWIDLPAIVVFHSSFRVMLGGIFVGMRLLFIPSLTGLPTHSGVEVSPVISLL